MKLSSAGKSASGTGPRNTGRSILAPPPERNYGGILQKRDPVQPCVNTIGVAIWTPLCDPWKCGGQVRDPKMAVARHWLAGLL